MSESHAEDGILEERPREATPGRLGIAALAHDAAIYGGARVLLKSLAFLLVPLYAHYVPTADFGRLELILAGMALIDVFVNFGGVLARFYFDDEDRAFRRRVITAFVVIEAAYPAVLVGLLIAFSEQISERLLGGAGFATLLVIALIDLYLTNIVDIPMGLCRLRRKPYTFAAYSLVRGLTQILLSILLVAVWQLGVKGILIASLASVCLAFVVTLREYVRDLTRHLDRRLVRGMLEFGWPTVVGGLAFYGLNLLDRFFVRHYHGLGDNGLYGVAFRYSQVVVVGVFAFRLGWPQWHYSWLRSDRHPAMVARGANYYFFGVGMLAVIVAAWILPVFELVLPDAYVPGYRAVAPLGIAAVATGAYAVFAAGLNVTKRMRLIPPTAIAASAVAVGLYFLLIPPFSYVGAAWATAASLSLLALMVLAVSQRVYPVPWDWRRIGTAVALILGLSLASLAIDAWVDLALSVPIRVAITLAFPLGLYASGFFPREDLAAARARFRRRR